MYTLPGEPCIFSHHTLLVPVLLKTVPWRAVETAFTVTFGRAGEDKKSFKLGSVEQTLAGFAGADYQLQAHNPSSPLPPHFFTAYCPPGISILVSARSVGLLLTWLPHDCVAPNLKPAQDAIVDASFQKSDKRMKDGQEYYDYEVFSPVSDFPTFLHLFVMKTQHSMTFQKLRLMNQDMSFLLLKGHLYCRSTIFWRTLIYTFSTQQRPHVTLLRASHKLAGGELSGIDNPSKREGLRPLCEGAIKGETPAFQILCSKPGGLTSPLSPSDGGRNAHWL